MTAFLNRVISWSFYVLFFLTPLAFVADTSELFEFNKMWIVFGLTTIIVGVWICKMILQRRIFIHRTLLDIPIVLFLLSQVISTIFSLDPHTSLWGYYSRFNGGLLSFIAYILLYYAFVSNVQKKEVIRYIFVSIASAIVVALWGLPSHFGYDPTCLIFRGTLDVACWTDAFQPKVRIFSTLGQPDWLAAYLDILLPVSLGLTVFFQKKKRVVLTALFGLTTILFFVDLLFTKARSGVVGIAAALFVFVGMYLWINRRELTKYGKDIFKKEWALLASLGLFLIFAFFIGTSIGQLDRFTFPTLQSMFATKQEGTRTSPKTQTASPTPPPSTGEIGGTDSGKIRLLVWEGALDIFVHHPIIGTGVETFAYAYYQYRPQEHNLTSEWDYLYNKAHNEYLNFLATTGILGLGTYLAFIFLFLWIAIKKLLTNDHIPYTNLEAFLSLGLLAGFVSILVTNFFGFSVVMVNIFLLMIPAFIFFLLNMIDENKIFSFPKMVSPKGTSYAVAANGKSSMVYEASGFQWLGMSIITLASLFILWNLFAFWNADRAYGLGLNLDHAGQYQTAYQPLHDAVSGRQEPTFQDELSINDAVLASALAKDDPATAQKLAQEALSTSTNLVTLHPNVITYWKTRVRILYTLAQQNPQLSQMLIEAIAKAHSLAPTDAKVAYNYGLILGQTGNLTDAITLLNQAIQLKPDYADPYYALAIFYHSAAVDKSGQIIKPDLQQKAIETLQYMEKHFADDKKVHDALKSWNAE